VFVNITQPYCNAAAARIRGHAAAVGRPQLRDRPDAATRPRRARERRKVPTHIQAAASQAQDQGAGKAADRQAAQQAKLMIDAANEKAKKAETRIEDWLVECQYHAEVRKMIEDAARIGSGVLKGPIPSKRRRIALENGELIIKSEIKPGSKRIDPWNFYPDGACGESIHNGSYTWERTPHAAAAERPEGHAGLHRRADRQVP
jgi:hypothetical protein